MTNVNTHALTERAMVANLSIGVWQGYKLDKAATRKVTDDNGASADAARVNKHTVPKEMLAPIVSAAGAVRSHFYDNTLPWRDNGDRLMTRTLFMPFIEQHERLVQEFKDAVDTFLTVKYQSAIEKAEFRMGALFKRDDYPSPSDLYRRFYVNLDIDALTTSDDFRVQIDAEQADKVRAAMEQAAEQRVQTAMQDVWQRLAKTVGYFAERMNDPGKVFRDSTVENIAELIDLIPGLNVLDDPNIEAVRQQVKTKLTGVDAKDIRKDPALRAELGGEAAQIVSHLEGFMKAFGPGDA
jgi:hypothetical protein